MDAPPLADRVFALVVEETAAVWSGSLNPLPEREVRLVRSLGCPRYECREVAESVLREMGPDAVRPLVWGSRHRDPEVAYRCGVLLARTFPCPSCGGGGREGHCYACAGTGSALYEYGWDAGGWVPVPRRLFTGLPSH